MNEAPAQERAASAEHVRLAEASVDHPGDWKALGPYLSERAWGTVREDYSADGEAWGYFPYEHARSRAYRWSEDGLAGISDLNQYMCFAFAFWNGRDPFLKERLFGLSGPEGNHGEDVKEYWWYVDATPTASWLRWRYHYPQSEFPYQRLREENGRRGRRDSEFELIDTGAFDEDKYWRIVVDYAKAGPRDLCVRVEIHNAGPEAAELHVLPTLWFRNRWSWGDGDPRPSIKAVSDGLNATAIAEDAVIGRWRLTAGPDPTGRVPELLFCENETNMARLFGVAARTPFPKDGVNDHVVAGASTVNPAQVGTKMACWHRVTVAPGGRVELRLRLARDDATHAGDLGADFDLTLAKRRREADEYYATLRPDGVSDDEAAVMRQAFSSLIWSQQFYHFNVRRWQDGDPTEPPPPAARRGIRNVEWRHLNCHDILVMPDKWEYPWFAAWDLAFQCVALAHVDPAAAKHQLRLLNREWYMHPNGQLPAYEWNFGDVNPPVQAWASLAVFNIDGGNDFDFLARAFHKLLITFTWWVNRKDAFGDNIFEGGFLGLDNIGPFNRSSALPGGAVLEQSDGTAWMAKLCLNMLEMAVRLANQDPAYEDVALKFFEHFAEIALAMDELWDEDDGFFYDRVRKPDGQIVTIRARSMVGLLPIFAAVQINASLWERLASFRVRAKWFVDRRPQFRKLLHFGQSNRPELICLVGDERLRRILARMLDETEFLSSYGLRSLSRFHRDHPLVLEVDGGGSVRLDYEPGESQTALFGGNSNWRGPIWLPLNYLAVGSLRNLHASLGEAFTVEMPTGSGTQMHLGAVADEIERRLLRLFLRDADGRRPVNSGTPRFDDDPAWSEQIAFHEYFHGETGQGLGASHQTGWTALIAALVAERATQK